MEARLTLLEQPNFTFDGEYAEIPERMQESLLAYINNGRLPGDFLRAVVSNELFGATGRADPENLRLLPLYVRWLYNRAPMSCFGSQEAMLSWSSKGGLSGQPN